MASKMRSNGNIHSNRHCHNMKSLTLSATFLKGSSKKKLNRLA